jgi:hypothetical protein
VRRKRKVTFQQGFDANLLDRPMEDDGATSAEEAMDAFDFGLYELRKRKKFKRLIPYVVTALVFSGLTFGAEYLVRTRQSSVENVALILHGGQTIDEKQLRTVVVKAGINVYWLGPKRGMKYVINTSQATEISLRCILPTTSSGANELYYDVGTFVSKDAFALTQEAAKQPNGVGFVNADGNAVYYDSRDPKNVYIGLKNADIQVEIYDPRPDQALAAALLPGNLKQIS